MAISLLGATYLVIRMKSSHVVTGLAFERLCSVEEEGVDRKPFSAEKQYLKIFSIRENMAVVPQNLNPPPDVLPSID